MIALTFGETFSRCQLRQQEVVALALSLGLVRGGGYLPSLPDALDVEIAVPWMPASISSMRSQQDRLLLCQDVPIV